MFIGRQKELKTLQEHYSKNEFTFIPIYGRRRVGKTQLIEEFIRNKRAIFFTAVNKGTYKNNIELLSKAIFEGSENSPVYNNFYDVLDGIYQIAQKEKLIFVIDEFPYLAQSEESIISILQQFIDLKFLKTNMMLILSGSSLSFMENQVLGYQSPLYGRRTGQIKLLPLDFQTARQFAPNLPKLDQAVMYGVTGAIPKYLSLFNGGLSLDENVRGQYFDRNAYLFEETDNLLKQEFKEPALYQSIITAIASGGSQMKDIRGKVGEESSTVATYMKSLLDTGIIKKEIPAMDKPGSRKTIYRLEDGMFRFWYRFVYPNVSLIALDKGSMVYERIKPQITGFMGEVFEKLCIEYMWSIYSELPFGFQNISRWWGNNPELKSQTEIDFIAYGENEEQVIFGECKWRNEELDVGIVKDLIERCRMFRQYRQKYYYFFSKSGFTLGVHELAKGRSDIRLITFKDMFELPKR
ncbi:MAG: ATP-binding protein [Oscillospiraceae bacterium]|jgi:AAA+ ATPase superfamily predicted ATPase|nr:ATP-binding protein [Oscillospiraceae bacterium]